MYFSLYDLKINLGFNAQDVRYFLCLNCEKEYEVLLLDFYGCTFPSFYYVAFALIAVLK